MITHFSATVQLGPRSESADVMVVLGLIVQVGSIFGWSVGASMVVLAEVAGCPGSATSDFARCKLAERKSCGVVTLLIYGIAGWTVAEYSGAVRYAVNFGIRFVNGILSGTSARRDCRESLMEFGIVGVLEPVVMVLSLLTVVDPVSKFPNLGANAPAR